MHDHMEMTSGLQSPENIFAPTPDILSPFCPSVSLCFVQPHSVL